MKINWLWSVLSSFGHSFKFFGKSALFVHVSFELSPQLSFWSYTRLASLAQSRFGSFAFALSFLKMIYQKFWVFKSHEAPQSLWPIRVSKFR
ncbi:hypothetical protein ATY35_21095 [Vibrio cidicii]|uniref:Uncharacterized protein n=1 Tax=Vibrio cidicii TaxID=1763883 RepID=A0ABR5W5A4_9VIBR|nr:hypothetical protein ATY35_21095 [Vibrio cidicii]